MDVTFYFNSFLLAYSKKVNTKFITGMDKLYKKITRFVTK